MGGRFWVAELCLLVFGVGLLAGTTVMAQTPSKVGDCEQATNSGSLKCSNVSDCGSSTCFAENNVCTFPMCTNNQCTAVLLTDIRKVGTCQAGAGPCFFCKTYYCAAKNIYQSKDILGQCQMLKCMRLQSNGNSCIP